MASNTNIDLINLDPDLAKSSFINYLKGQSFFKSYDFTGSNLNELLSLLGTNTFKFSFFLNMINAESWLDSAQLRSSVVSHAKDLNYLPRSAKSSVAIISLTIPTDGLINVIAINKAVSFSGRAGTQSFNFSVDQTQISTSLVPVFQVPSLTIYEGLYLSDVFVMDYSLPRQRFILTNLNIDVSSITVIVTTNSGAVVLEYTFESSLLGLLPNSLSYFLQCNEQEQYEVLFGNNLFGLEPPNGAVITITYRVTTGSSASDGVQSFSINSDVTNGHLAGTITATVVQSSIGGSGAEDIDSIRFNAPRYYATQERAVSETDYETLMLTNFPEVIAVAAFGGETQNPPVYGSVYISVVLSNILGLPDSKKTEYFNFIRPRSIMKPVFITPQNLFYGVTSTINYNINSTTLLPNDIATIVTGALVTYNQVNFDNFNVLLRYSPFCSVIDNAHPSILGNETDITIIVKLTPTPLITQNLDIQTGVPIFDDYPPIPLIHDIDEVHAVYSSSFIFNNQSVILEDDSRGIMRIVSSSGNNDMVVQNIGIVNYATGEIQLTGISFQSYSKFIKLYIIPATKDISVNGNNILNLDPADINLTVVAAQE